MRGRTPRRHRAGRSLLALGTCLVLIAGCGGGDGGSSAAGGWPSVPLQAMDGTEVDSADLVPTGSGPVLVNLWATWCKPCKRELPMLQELAQEGTVPVVGVNIGDEPSAVASFLDELGITYRAVIDVDGELMSQLEVPSLPATVLVEDGEVLWTHLGEATRADVEAALAAAG